MRGDFENTSFPFNYSHNVSLHFSRKTCFCSPDLRDIGQRLDPLYPSNFRKLHYNENLLKFLFSHFFVGLKRIYEGLEDRHKTY